MKNYGSYQSKNAPTGKATWLVTFGDLLTLLLCFFIATFASQTPATLASTRNKTIKAATTDNKLPQVSETNPGTSLALVPSIVLCVSEDVGPPANEELLVSNIRVAHEMAERARHLIDTSEGKTGVRIAVGGSECDGTSTVTRIVETKS